MPTELPLNAKDLDNLSRGADILVVRLVGSLIAQARIALELEQEVARLRGLVPEIVSVLEPFADLAAHFSSRIPDDALLWDEAASRATVGASRRASELVAKLREG